MFSVPVGALLNSVLHFESYYAFYKFIGLKYSLSELSVQEANLVTINIG